MAAGLQKELCLFDEHTWGSSNSVALPDSLDSVGQWNEKARLAFRPMALAEWLVSERARGRAEPLAPGLWVFNPTPSPFTGWVAVPATALRSDYPGIDHYEAGLQPWNRPRSPADLSPENDTAVFADAVPKQIAKFWVEGLAPHSYAPVGVAPAETAKPEVRTGAHGWPVEVRWPGMSATLFPTGFGDFLAVKPTGFAPRWVLSDMAAGKPGQVEESAGVYGAALMEETGHTLVYTQAFTHPRLKRARRRLEIWKGEARARVTVTIYRTSSDDPESLYMAFQLPVAGAKPQVSAGGMPFTPYEDQLPGSCRDYFAIDGWVHYRTSAGDWLWVSRDAPLVSFGRPEVWKRRKDAADTSRILSNVFNNFWYTNFVGNEHGAMEFQYDLAWRRRIEDPAGMARTLASELPVVQR